jgi:N-acetyl-anhydromuramyl-L-alanine amidase AmpD
MAEPPDIEGEGVARADGPIPAPVGPPGAVVWPPPATAAGASPARAPAVAVGALPADVTDVAAARAWTTIVIHHSASKVGGAARFDQWHRAKGLDGVGYHFVIGNGTDTPDGAIETTARWKDQADGVHAKGWDTASIGVCLVGNFEDSDPTPAQMDALRQLVRHLRGRFSIPRERVVGHAQVNATACPGRRLSVKAVAAATDPSRSPGPTESREGP